MNEASTNEIDSMKRQAIMQRSFDNRGGPLFGKLGPIESESYFNQKAPSS